MRRSLPALILVAPVCLWLAGTECAAQSLFGSGSSSRSGSSSGSSSRSGSSSGSSRSGSSGTGTSGSYQSGSLLSLDQDITSSVGQNAFVGRSNSTGFVGQTNASGMTSRGMMSGNRSMFSGLQSSMSGQNRNGFSQGMNQGFNQNGNNQLRNLKPQLQIGFDYVEMQGPPLAGVLQQRMTTIPAVQTRIPGVSFIADENGLVTLTGSVARAEDRHLAEMLVRLEPGVRTVQNDISIAPQP